MNYPLNALIPDIPIGEYHALPRLSASGIGSLLKSPAHFKAKVWGEPSKAMRIGSGVHLLTLEPHLVASMMPVAPVVNKRTKAGKAEWEAWVQGLPRDAVLLDAEERAVAVKAAAAVLGTPSVQKLGLLEGKREQSIMFDIEGCPAKCRPDNITEGGILVDVKTCRDAAKFDRALVDFGHHRQAALYSMGAHAAGLDPKAFVFIVVETSDEMMNSAIPSNFVRIVTLDDPTILQGERDVYAAAKIYRECLESDVWPGYSSTIDTIGLPIWAFSVED